MRSSILSVAGCLALLFAWEWFAVSVSAQAAEPLELTGDRYRLVSHVLDKAAAAQALAVCEASWPAALMAYGIDAPDPKEPFTVHLYRDPAGYEEAEEKLTQGRFKRNLAFAHWDTQTAHVALQPQLPDAFVQKLGINFQTLRLLVHEASHLARFHVLPNYRSHPGWFADGNASWIETEVLRSMDLFSTPEQDPSFASDVVRVQRLIADEELPPMAKILGDELDELDFYEVYAVRWLLFRYLMQDERRPALHKTVADMRRYGGGRGFVERVAKSLAKHLRDRGAVKLDAGFRAWVTTLEPQWDEVYPSLETHGAEWTHTAFDSVNGISWSTARAGEGSWELSGSVEILDDGRKQMNVLLGRSETGFVSIAFTQGAVTVLDYTSAENSWKRLALGSAALPLGRPIRFSVAWSAEDGLRVAVAGKAAAECQVERSLAGPWGLGAQAGSSGNWRDVALTSR